MSQTTKQVFECLLITSQSQTYLNSEFANWKLWSIIVHVPIKHTVSFQSTRAILSRRSQGDPQLDWLVVYLPSENMNTSVGMMKSPTEWKIKINKIHVPNHQPVEVLDMLLYWLVNYWWKCGTKHPFFTTICGRSYPQQWGDVKT